MKPDPLEAAVVSHRMDDHAVQQRSRHSDEGTEKSSSSGSPRNSDIIFETWDMVNMFLLWFSCFHDSDSEEIYVYSAAVVSIVFLSGALYWLND